MLLVIGLMGTEEPSFFSCSTLAVVSSPAAMRIGKATAIPHQILGCSDSSSSSLELGFSVTLDMVVACLLNCAYRNKKTESAVIVPEDA
jgi:hypothetical protein